MTILTIYGIPSCDTCRKARKWLTDNHQEHQFHDLRADGLDLQMLDRWAVSLDWQTLLNTRSVTWRRIPEIDRTDITRSRAFALMLTQPTLVKRPLLERATLIAVGYSAAIYEALLAAH